MIIPNRIKITLVLGGVTSDVTNDIVEWDSLEILEERDNVSGVITSVSFPVKLRGQGMELMKAAFDKDGLYSTGTMNVYQRGDHDSDYTLIKASPLDFSTYEEHDSYVSVECAESELSDILNSEGKTKFDIPVNEIKETKQWKYNRMQVKNIGIYTLPEDTDISYSDNDAPVIIDNFLFPVTLNKADQAPGTSEVDFKDQSSGLNSEDYFLKCSENGITLHVDSDFDFEVTIDVHGYNNDSAREVLEKSFHFGLFKLIDGKWYGIVTAGLVNNSIMQMGDLRWSGTYTGSLKINDLTQELGAGEQVTMMIYTPNGGIFWAGVAAATISMNIKRFGKFEAYYYEASKNSVNIDVIKPARLFQKYLDMMAGENKFTVDINWEEDRFDTMIVAAESIRGFGDANRSESPATLHGSPNDFIDWMKVLGYEPVISGNNITFELRRNVFLVNFTAIELGEGEVADLIKQADSTHAYTSVEIGYEKQDYENENGRYEANGTYAYTTGYVAREDNKLSLISPYRGDSMGIEFLCQERDNYTTDNKSDNDIFFVALTYGNTYYTEYKGMIIDTDSHRIQMFNAPFNPYFLVKWNESLIGINTRKLEFKSTNMSRDAIIEGYDIYGDIEITKKLFSPIIYNFATGHYKELPSVNNRDGLVKFNWHGKVLQGYIKSIRKNYITEEETTWELHAKLDNN